MAIKQMELSAKPTKAAGIAEFKELVGPSVGAKLKIGDEVSVDVDSAKQIVKTLQKSGYETETHGATRKGKQIGRVWSVMAKCGAPVSFTVRIMATGVCHVFVLDA